jgi:hypothetical protein
LESILRRVAEALGKRVQELVVVMLNRPRHADFIAEVRLVGAACQRAQKVFGESGRSGVTGHRQHPGHGPRHDGGQRQHRNPQKVAAGVLTGATT